MGRNIVDVLDECGGGTFLSDCTKGLEVLIKEIEKYGKSGTLTLTLKVTPNHDGTASVKPSLKIEAPQKGHRSEEFFLNGNSLHKRNPNQADLFEGKNVTSIDSARKSHKEEDILEAI